METLVVSRDGVRTLMARFESRSDGTLWASGTPLLDGQAPEFLSLGKDAMIALVKAKRYSEIPAGCYAKLGLNPSGLLVQRQADLEAAQEAERIAYLAEHPEVVERAEIDRLFAWGSKINNDWSEEADTGKGFGLIAEAEERLAAWRAKYPDAAREEAARELEARADHEDDLAVGALTYDADGSISPAGQQERHDEYQAKARELRARAAEIRRG